MTLQIVTDKVAAPKFKQNLAGLHDRFEKAFTTSMNMAASMIKNAAVADIAAAGDFGDRWTKGLNVEVIGTLGNMRISMTSDVEGMALFETGGEVKGNPMLWIPLSFSDAKGIRASEYSGGLFSVQRRDGGRPLLFSISDKLPKYFGIESVTIPKKFHLSEIQASVMSNYRSIFDEAFKATE